jgi:hypothetical protein
MSRRRLRLSARVAPSQRFEVNAGFDFSDADRVPPAKFNKVLWMGLMGGKPYPAAVGPEKSAKLDD